MVPFRDPVLWEIEASCTEKPAIFALLLNQLDYITPEYLGPLKLGSWSDYSEISISRKMMETQEIGCTC